jgi:ADP-ribosylglycohydrolase
LERFTEGVKQWGMSSAKSRLQELLRALEFSSLSVEQIAPRSATGHTTDTLACALWAVKGATSFEDALVKAVNLGGDADTVGAVAGGLAGVRWGYDAIPGRWSQYFTPEQRARLDHVVKYLVCEAGQFSLATVETGFDKEPAHSHCCGEYQSNSD